MPYYHPESGQIFQSAAHAKAVLTNIVFDDPITDESLAFANVFPLVSEKPPADGSLEAFPLVIENVDGIWTQLWTMREPTEQELVQRHLDRKALVPKQITRAQGILALLLTKVPGTDEPYLRRVDPAIVSIPDPMQREIALIEWKERPTFERESIMVNTIGALIGLDEDGLDELFILAGTK